ncbi:Uncharacterized protein Fot_13029 [Forsythia ovata]|uniref:Uncharacterized protein n=1 Tax=Forsythia ovata TaxID=205694 RepID=A0ABD1W2B6_9LAMI
METTLPLLRGDFFQISYGECALPGPDLYLHCWTCWLLDSLALFPWWHFHSEKAASYSQFISNIVCIREAGSTCTCNGEPFAASFLGLFAHYTDYLDSLHYPHDDFNLLTSKSSTGQDVNTSLPHPDLPVMKHAYLAVSACKRN